MTTEQQPYYIQQCRLCGLGPCDRMIRCLGAPDSPLVIVGEAPAREERDEGEVFIGPSGQLLRYALAQAELDTYDPWVTNAVKCYSPGNPTNKQIDACGQEYLINELLAYKRKLVILCGGSAHRALGKPRAGVNRRLGTFDWGEMVDSMLMFTIHPSAALYRHDQYSWLLLTLRNAKAFMEGKMPLPAPPSVEVTESPMRLAEVLQDAVESKFLVFDVETSGKSWQRDRLLGAGFAAATGKAVYAPAEVLKCDPARRMLIDALENPEVRKVAHNAKFDAHWMREVFGARLANFEDSMALAQFANENLPLNLKTQAVLRLGVARWDSELEGTSAYTHLPLHILGTYGALDVAYTRQLYRVLHRQDWIAQSRAYQVVTEALPIFVEVERRGMRIHTPLLEELISYVEGVLAESLALLQKMVGETFNPNSYPQVSAYLFTELGVVSSKHSKTTGNPSADKTVLAELLTTTAKRSSPTESLVQDFCLGLLRFRRASKLLNTTLNGIANNMDRSGILRATFNLSGTRTGRLSSSDPINLQNLPKYIRPLFIPREGYVFVEFDLGQIEVRIWAELSRDPVLLKAVYDADEDRRRYEDEVVAGVKDPAPVQDIHRQVASLAFNVPIDQVTSELRSRAKSVTFGLIYGEDSRTLANKLGSLELAMAVREAFFHRFETATKWLDEQCNEASKTGVLRTPTGRCRHLPAGRMRRSASRHTTRYAGEVMRQAMNSPVQSYASDVTLFSIVNIYNHLKKIGTVDANLVVTVHDSQMWEVKEEHAEALENLIPAMISKTAEEMGIEVPILCDGGRYTAWGGDFQRSELDKYLFGADLDTTTDEEEEATEDEVVIDV